MSSVLPTSQADQSSVRYLNMPGSPLKQKTEELLKVSSVIDRKGSVFLSPLCYYNYTD